MTHRSSRRPLGRAAALAGTKPPRPAIVPPPPPFPIPPPPPPADKPRPSPPR